MDTRKMLAIAALVLAGLALQAAILQHFVVAPLASALRATQAPREAVPGEAVSRPEFTEEIEVVAPRRAKAPPTEETKVAGGRR